MGTEPCRPLQVDGALTTRKDGEENLRYFVRYGRRRSRGVVQDQEQRHTLSARTSAGMLSTALSVLIEMSSPLVRSLTTTVAPLPLFDEGYVWVTSC